MANPAPHHPIIRRLPGEAQARHFYGFCLEGFSPRPVQASKPNRAWCVGNGIRKGRIKTTHIVLDFAHPTMHFHPDPKINGQVRPQLDVVLGKKRRVLGPHSVLRLSRGAPLLHIS